MQETGIRPIELIKAGKDAPKMFNLANKTLDQMTLPVQPAVVFTQHLCPLMRWNNRLNTATQQVVDEMSCRIATISNKTIKIKSLKQMLSLRDVMALSCGQAQSQRVAERINRYMDFGCESASASSECLLSMFFLAPAAQGWARIIVLSIIPFSRSGSSAK